MHNVNTTTILIVDDEPFNITLLSDLLSDKYRILVATNGLQALKRVNTSQPDLILLDIMMPEMDGYEVCRQLKADDRTKDVPVIFLSAKGLSREVDKGFRCGPIVVDYLVKPISTDGLTDRVEAILSSSQERGLETLREESLAQFVEVKQRLWA